MEEILNWHWWMYAGILLLILEVFTPGFIVACLGIGALTASGAAYFGMNIDAQLITFAISTSVSLFIIRPILLKRGGNEEKIKTNTDALIGRTGTVVEAIDNNTQKGRVLIDGDQWKAHTNSTEFIPENTKVEVTSIDSTILTVKKI